MVHVQVRFYGMVKGLVEEPQVELRLPQEGSARDIIKGLIARFGPGLADRILDGQGKLYNNIKLFINNKEVHDLETKLPALEDTAQVVVYILSSVEGGSEEVWHGRE